MIFRAAAALFCMAFLAGCGGVSRRADLVFINGAEPETLDPAIITGQPEGRVVNALFEGLCAYDETGRAVPGVAESWEISPDGKHYTFHLRPDARLPQRARHPHVIRHPVTVHHGHHHHHGTHMPADCHGLN